jgi:hypothetical protein
MRRVFACAPQDAQRALFASIALLGPVEVLSAEFSVGDWNGSFTGLVTLGTMVREKDGDPTLINQANGQAIGVRATSTGGMNGDSGNLNFRQGDAVSTVVKAYADLAVKRQTAGISLRVKAWYDYALQDRDVPWGNYPNGLHGDTQLGDNGFPHRARFSGAALQNLYVYDTYSLAGRPLYLSLGEQTIPWGTNVTIAGGLSAIRPVDGAAAQRPGSVPEETEVPVPALFGRLRITEQATIEGYYQFRFVPGVTPGCGTFFATTDWIAPGCDVIFTGAVAGIAAPSNRDRLAAGAVVKRDATPSPSDSGLFGIGATYQHDSLHTLFGAYFARYNQTTFVTRDVVKSLRTGATPFVVGDPGGLNPRYLTRYPEGVKVFALNFDTRAKPWGFYGEISWRPNQPVGLNAGDQLAAITSNTTPTLLRADISALPPGGTLRGFDLLRTGQAQLGLERQFRDLLGASLLTLRGEVAVKHVDNLPDVTVRRYGRSDVFGAGPVKGVCAGGTIDTTKQCSNDGFVTRNAWGFNMSAAFTYVDVVPGLTLTPRALLAIDFKGWSYDGLFSEGRSFALLSLAALYREKYTATVAFGNYSGGRYSVIKDRSYVSLAAGVKF